MNEKEFFLVPQIFRVTLNTYASANDVPRLKISIPSTEKATKTGVDKCTDSSSAWASSRQTFDLNLRFKYHLTGLASLQPKFMVAGGSGGMVLASEQRLPINRVSKGSAELRRRLMNMEFIIE